MLLRLTNIPLLVHDSRYFICIVRGELLRTRISETTTADGIKVTVSRAGITRGSESFLCQLEKSALKGLKGLKG